MWIQHGGLCRENNTEVNRTKGTLGNLKQQKYLLFIELFFIPLRTFLFFFHFSSIIES